LGQGFKILNRPQGMLGHLVLTAHLCMIHPEVHSLLHSISHFLLPSLPMKLPDTAALECSGNTRKRPLASQGHKHESQSMNCVEYEKLYETTIPGQRVTDNTMVDSISCGVCRRIGPH
jgi:hypothetical protein